jgi:hypothetical protein
MIIGTLFVIATPGSFVFDNPEKRLILLEQMMYQNTDGGLLLAEIQHTRGC